MELYFKDLEDEAGAVNAGIDLDHGACCVAESRTPAEEEAFAELSERVSAARLVY